MRQFLIAWLICIAVYASEPERERAALVVHHKSVLRWVDQNPPGSTAFFMVQIFVADRLIETQRIEKPEIELGQLLKRANAGEYKLRILTVDQSGLNSAPSEAVTIHWIGSGIS